MNSELIALSLLGGESGGESAGERAFKNGALSVCFFALRAKKMKNILQIACGGEFARRVLKFCSQRGVWRGCGLLMQDFLRPQAREILK